jgi:hypothetical protein
MASIHKNFTIPEELVNQLNARGETLSAALRESLARYFYMLDRARADLRDRFTAQELSLLCDCCNGTWWEPHTLDGIVANAEDTEQERYDYWRVDRAALLDKMRALSLLECAALVDAVERFWRATSTGMAVEPGRILG